MQVTTFTGMRRDIQPTSATIFQAINADIQHDLSRGTVPDPFTARAAYRKEPFISEGRRAEIWRTWWQILADGWGDCEDWARFFVAWMWQRGDRSSRIALIEFPAGGWHAVAATRQAPIYSSPSIYRASNVARRYPGASIYLGPGINPEGWFIIDLAYAHGMRDPFAPSVYMPGIEAAQREPVETAYKPGIDPYYTRGLEVSGIEDIPWYVWGAALTGIGVGYAVTRKSKSAPIVDLTDINRLPYRTKWGRYGTVWAQRLIQIARELGIAPDWLLAVMDVEASGIDYKATNPKSGAYGLIQFMPSTLRNMGYSTDAVKKFSALEQLELVRMYLMPYKGRMHSIADLYTVVFLPARLGRDVLTYKGELNKKGKLLRYYEDNEGLDLNKNGSIEAGEPGQKARDSLEREYRAVGISGVRDDDPPLLLAWRTSTTAGNTVALLGQAAGLTTDTRLLRQIVTMIRMFSSLPSGYDVSDDSAYIEYLIRRAYGLVGSAESDPGVIQTLENMASAGGETLAVVKPLAESSIKAASAIADAGASAAEGVSKLPWYFWGAMAVGGGLLALRYFEKETR